MSAQDSGAVPAVPNAWDVLPPKVQELMRTGVSAGFTFSRCVLPISGIDRDGKPAGGSGFIVAVGEYPPKGEPEFVFVTARHIAEQAQKFGINLELIARRIPEDRNARLFPTVRIPLDNALWQHGRSDVSIQPFPIDHLPDDHALSAVHHGVFVTQRHLYYSTATDLELYGRWTLRDETAIVVARRALLASFERPAALLDILPDAKTRCEIYLADGTVSKGMSGGLVAIGSGGSESQSGVLGLIHGYWPLNLQEMGLDDKRAAEFEDLQREIGRLNGGMVYIIPAHAIDELLEPIKQKLLGEAKA